MKLLQKGNTPNIPTETYLCDSVEEINLIPLSAPIGSVAIVLTNDGLGVKMKNNSGEWKEL